MNLLLDKINRGNGMKDCIERKQYNNTHKAKLGTARTVSVGHFSSSGSLTFILIDNYSILCLKK